MPQALRLAALLATVAGCAAQSDSAAGLASIAFVPQCSTSSQCTAGTVCKAPYGVCVTSEHNGSTVALAVSPPAKVSPVVHIGSVTFSPDNTYDVHIPQTIVITGIVKAGPNVVPATLVAVTKDPIIKGALMRSQAAFKSGDPFKLQLFAGYQYNLTISVDDGGKTPPHHEEIAFSTSEIHDFALPDPAADYTCFTGAVKIVQGGMPVGIKGARVTAVQPKSEDQCTSTVTDTHGTFELLCPSNAALDIVVSGDSDGPVLPTFTTSFVWKDYVPQTSPTCLALPYVIVPPETHETTATVLVTDATDAPLAGIAVTASAVFDKDGWTHAVLRVEGTTDTDGKATLHLLDGSYHVTVAPHPTDPWAVKQDDTPWDVTAEPIKTVTLGKKEMLTTSVVDHAGRPVPGAKVVATASLVDAATKTSADREYVTETGANGGFQLPVDPEFELDLAVIPPEDSGLPRWWRAEVLVVHSGGAAPAPFTLAQPSLIEGNVLDAAGAPVGEAAVDVYTTPKPKDGPARLIGRGVSTPDGRYFLILPCPKP